MTTHGAQSQRPTTSWPTGDAGEPHGAQSRRHLPPAWFGPELRRMRRTAGLSLRQAADRVDVSFGYLGQLERGERCSSVVVAASLAWAYGLDVDNRDRLLGVAIPGVGRDWTGRDW